MNVNDILNDPSVPAWVRLLLSETKRKEDLSVYKEGLSLAQATRTFHAGAKVAYGSVIGQAVELYESAKRDGEI